MTSLENAAAAVWRLATMARHDRNYGRAVDAMNRLRPYLTAPNPRLRRLARPFWDAAAATGRPGDAA